MSTIDLKEYPQFRKDSKKLSEDLVTMLGEMDSIVSDSRFSEAAKEDRIGKILSKYLPE